MVLERVQGIAQVIQEHGQWLGGSGPASRCGLLEKSQSMKKVSHGVLLGRMSYPRIKIGNVLLSIFRCLLMRWPMALYSAWARHQEERVNEGKANARLLGLTLYLWIQLVEHTC